MEKAARGLAMLQKQASKIDKLIGLNIRTYRLAKKMSQTDLANKLGVSFQQVQKYENGSNRIGSGRLHQAAQVLGVHVSALFAGGEKAEQADALNLLSEADAVRFLRAFSKIKDLATRRLLVQIAEKASERFEHE